MAWFEFGMQKLSTSSVFSNMQKVIPLLLIIAFLVVKDF